MPLNDSYTNELEALFTLEFTGMKLGLDNIAALLALIDNPHRKFKSIHIAGSNGKGSVSAMLAAALQAHGLKVGLFTSPHLVDFRERIKINGVMIRREAVSEFLQKHWPTVKELQSTFFETTTALAFDHFANEHVDVAVIETGLGGRLDATNILEHPLATVITSISLEHTQILGDTLEAIAGEKAGIFKKDAPAIVSVQDSIKQVFKAKATEVGTTVRFSDEVEIPGYYSTLEPPFAGEHQRANLRTVLATVEILPLELNPAAIIEGIKNTVILTGLRARLEPVADPAFVSKGVTVITDVGHNPDAFKQLAKHFTAHQIKPLVVLGLVSDKDRTEIFSYLKSFASSIITVAAESHRAVASATLASEAAAAGLTAIDGGSVVSGVKKAAAMATAGDTVLICGSHYVIGEYLASLKRL